MLKTLTPPGAAAGAPDSVARSPARDESHWLPLAFIVVLMAPSVIWIFADRTVWPWDQAWYGEVTLDLAYAWTRGPLAWVQGMSTAIGSKPPLLVWLAQILVPLSGLLGGVERALLLVNVAANAGTLWIIYATARQLGASRAAALAGMLFCGGASLFVGMSHQFLVEPLQSLAVAGLVWLALRAASAPLLQLLGLGVILTAMNLAAKTSSVAFVMPMLFYMTLVLAVTWQAERPAATRGDRIVLCLGAGFAVFTLFWYVRNWNAVVKHVIAATVGPEVLLYGSQGALATKLSFWIAALAQAVSPWSIAAAGMALVVAAAIVVEIIREVRRPPRDWVGNVVSSHLLFVLALAGTTLASILAYSLQINEETRFLLPIIPILAVLLSWSLEKFDRPALNVGVIVALIAGYIVVESTLFGVNWASARVSPWLKPYQADAAPAERLTQAVRQTCARAYANRYTIIGVELPHLNANSAAFYSAKARRNLGYRCYYTSLGYAESDTEKAFRRIGDIKARFVVTISPDHLASEADPFNRVARPVSERLASDSGFAPVADLGAGLLVYKRVSSGAMLHTGR